MELSSYIKQITHSAYFKNIIMVCILLNTVTFACTASVKPTDENSIFLMILEGFDCCFLGIYTMEFVLKLHTHGRGYWFNGFNCFDFVILLFSHIQLVLSNTGAKDLGVIKVMRSLRALRPLRSVSLIGGLQVVVTALIATLTGSFIHIISLLTLLMFVYAIMGFYCFGYSADGTVSEYWGSFGNSFLSLFVLVTAEGWGKIEQSLTDSGNSKFGSKLFIITFLFLGHVIFGNLFVAVVIEQIDKATAGYQLKLALKKSTVIARKRRKAKNEQESEIKQLLDKQNNQGFNNYSYPQVVLEMYGLMRTDEFKVLWEMKSSFVWVQMFNNEYGYLTNACRNLVSVHKEAVEQLGTVLSEMDESVQEELMERAIREQITLEAQTFKKHGSFFSRRTTIATLLPFVFSRMEDVGMEGELQPISCIGCLEGIFTNCTCTNPERIRLENMENDDGCEGGDSKVSIVLPGVSVPGKRERDSLASWIDS